MPLGSRSSLGAVAGVAVALALPVAAMACTPDEYLTAEERASGLYDTTPPDYYAGSDAPHTHGDAGAPAAAEAPAQTPQAEEPKAVAPAKARERDARRAPAGGEAPAPVVTPVSAPVVSEPTMTTPAPAAALPPSAIESAATARARAKERSARAKAVARAQAARAAARQKARMALEVQRPPVRSTASRPAAVAADPRRAAVPSDTAWQWVPLAAGLATLLAGIGVLMGRRRRLIAVQAPDGVDPIEAELQAMLAEEHARRAAQAEPDRSRI